MQRRHYAAIIGVAILTTLAWLGMRRPALDEESRRELAHHGTLDAPTSGATRADGVRSARSEDLRLSADSSASAKLVESRPTPTSGAALPIDVIPGLDYLRKSATEMKDTDVQWSSWRRHQQLQSEPRDEAWAPRMETALREGIEASLTAKGLDTQRIELPVVECRSTGCEIQAVGYAEDNMRAGVDLQDILPRILNGSLANEFDLDQFWGSMSSRSDQRVLFLMMLPRKKT